MSLVQALKDGFLWLILQILSFISWGVSFAAEMSGKLVNWVIGPDFLGGLSYTNPASNPIIQTGLNVTQSLVNMILVLILIYIALATILRIQNYQAQKLLPVFIAIALLVNFTPVICGLIVDASNILMNFFVERIHADRFGELVRTSLDSNAVDPNSTIGTSLYNQIVQLFFLIPFMGMLAFIMLVFAAIFALRHIAIWMLVILSPLAFIAFILPVTKKWWSMWWNQFINWCFVGVTLGFFLYLSLFFMIRIPSAPPSGSMPSIATQQFTGAIGFLTGIIFLGAGLVFGLKTSAMGASTVLNFAAAKGKQYGIEPIKRQTQKIAKAPLKLAAGTGSAIAGAAQGAKEGRGLGRISGAFKGAATYAGREKGKEAIAGFLEKMHLMRPGTYEASRRKRWNIEEETKKMENLSNDKLHEVANRKTVTSNDKASAIAAFEVLAKRGDLKDSERKLIPQMQSFGADVKQILKARPDWAPDANKTIKGQVGSQSTGDFTKNTQAEALQDVRVIICLDAPKIQHIGNRGTAEQKAALAEVNDNNSLVYAGILNEIKQQHARGNHDEARRIIRVVRQIQNNPNLRT